MSPWKLCATAGCTQPAILKGRCGPCLRAIKARSDAQRPTSRQRGYDAAWERLRRAVLARDPVCVACYQLPSRHVDHIVPRRAGGSDEPENLQGLCAPCHARKTATSDGGFGNAT